MGRIGRGIRDIRGESSLAGLVGFDEEHGHGAGEVDGQLGVAGRWFAGGLALAVGVAEAVSQGAQAFDDRVAGGEDAREDEFVLFTRSDYFPSKLELRRKAHQMVSVWLTI